MMMTLRHGLFGVLVATFAIGVLIAVGIFGLAIPADQWPGLLAILAVLWIIIVVQGWSLSRNKELVKAFSKEGERLQSVLDALPVLVSYVDANERFQYNNLAFEGWFGLHPRVIKGMLVRDLIGESAYQASQNGIELALAGQVTAFHEVSYLDQGKRWLQLTFIPDRGVGGVVNGFVALVRDVTEQKQLGQQFRESLEEDVQERTVELQEANAQLQRTMAEREQIEQALRQSEEHFRLLAENVQDTIFRYDLLPHPQLTYVSPAVTRINGYTPEEHYANPSLSIDLIHADDLHRLSAVMAEPTKYHEPIEVRWQHKNGTLIWAEQRHVPILDERGNCVTVVGVTRDITARRQAEDQLRQLSLAVEQSPVSITITDIEGNIEYVNPTFTRVTGFAFEDVLGKKPRMFTDDDAQTKKPRHLLQTLLTGTEWRGELHSRTKMGQPYWDSGVISPIYDDQGKITHLLAVMEDITQRKQQEREREAILAVTVALRGAHDRDEMLSVFLQELTTTLDAGKTFFIAPDSATDEIVIEAVYEQGEFRRTSGVRIAPGKGVAARVYKTSQPYITDDALNDPSFVLPDMLGEARAVACVPLVTHEKTIGLFSVARQAPWTHNDIRLLFAIADMAATGLERAALHEEALRHTAGLEREVAEHTHGLREANLRLQELDKLKSKFVSDVSHELRTPVTNVSLYLKLLRRRPEKQEQYLQILEEQANRLETLVLDVLDLARLDDKPEVTLSLVDLNELLSTVVVAQQAKAESLNLKLSFCQNDRLPLVYGDANKLMQVATNLVTNALNYTPTGQIQLCTYSREPQSVSFDVADSGTGIYPEDMPHLYERFYRGRRDRVSDVPGSGLGLSIVKELIELQGGSICVDSKVGVGTTFTVTLPAATPAQILPRSDGKYTER